MKNLDYNELENILTLIQANPSTTIGLFTNKDKELIEFLYRLSQNKEVDFIANITDKTFYEQLEDKTYCKYFALKRANYMINGKFYDYLFVHLDLDEEFKEEFFKRVHKVIKNAGLILIFAPKNDYATLDKYYQILEEHYYVATNKIDIDNNYTLIVSRKMHGWGG